MKESKNINKGFKLFFLVFAVIALVFVREDNQHKVIQLFNSFTYKEKVLQLDKIYEDEGGENLEYFKNSIVKWDNNKISFLNVDGSIDWIKEFDFSDPAIKFGDNTIFVFDKTLGDIYLINNKGETTGRIGIKSPIFNIKESNNYILVHIKESNQEIVKVFDIQGIQVGDYIFENENVLTYACNEDGSKVIVSTIDISNRELKSILSTYKDGKLTESIEIFDEIILVTEFANNELIVLTDSSVKLIGNEKVIWTNQYPLVRDIIIDKNKIHLLYGDNLEIINLEGESVYKMTYSLEYQRLFKLDKYIGIYGNKDILILQNSEEIIKHKVDEDIIRISGNDNQIAIHYPQKLEINKIANKE